MKFSLEQDASGVQLKNSVVKKDATLKEDDQTTNRMLSGYQKIKKKSDEKRHIRKPSSPKLNSFDDVNDGGARNIGSDPSTKLANSPDKDGIDDSKVEK